MTSANQSTHFDAADYWERRLGDHFGLEAVGDQSLGVAYNTWLYRVRSQRFTQLISDLRVDVANANVLDVGSGTGFYLDLWQRLGAKSVTGSDLTLASVRRLQSVYPNIAIKQLDIGSTHCAGFSRGSFDVISAFDMFFHIVDDECFARALDNLAMLLKPSGLLLFTDSLMTGPGGRHSGTKGETHIVFRRQDDVVALLGRSGFSVVDERPAFVLMNAPVDSTSRVRHAFWSLLCLIVRRGERAGETVGRALYTVELRLLARSQRSPATRMFACRKT
jgi:SAM-dependent methyltransferase